jgi:BirA family biotin operon repressor/biotin-[acetyl-CoA-carboxylase] ligase
LENNDSKTLFVGRSLHFFEELASTNTFAMEWIAKSKPIEGTVVWAGQQTAGRGQFGCIWETEPATNLTFSLILYPTFLSASQQFALSKAVAVAIHDFLSHYTSGVSIKWPNDIYIQDKKAAGILIENTLNGQQISASVIGIGININQKNFENLPKATSLSNITGKEYNLYVLLQHLFTCLEQRYLQLRAGKNFNSAYTSLLYRFAEDACYQRTSTSEILWGRIISVSPFGKLSLQHAKGIEEFDLKEIRFLD